MSKRVDMPSLLTVNPEVRVYFAGLLNLCYDSLESIGVVDCEVSEHLAVDFDAGLVQQTHQLAIAEALHAGSGIDTLNPKGAEVALLGTTVTIGVGQTLLPCVLGYCPDILAGSKIATGELENSLTFCS